MDPRRLVRVSKFLSRHLRHQPQRLGLALEPGGWVAVEKLLDACAAAGFRITRDELDEVVARNDKQRFSFDPPGRRIRANQGHSVAVDLELEPAHPRGPLFHGTSRARLDAIMREGLRPMRRHHVHLSPDAGTARAVGARHGAPVVLEVAAPRMAAEGARFFLSANGVWLTDVVAPRYLTEAQPPRRG